MEDLLLRRVISHGRRLRCCLSAASRAPLLQGRTLPHEAALLQCRTRPHVVAGLLTDHALQTLSLLHPCANIGLSPQAL